MRRIAFTNEKGGTCKTTLCVNVAAYLAAHGERVLVADLDTQGHAGKSLGVDVREIRPTVFEWLLGTATLDEVLVPTAVKGLELLPANKDLSALPVALASAPDRADRLDRRLDALPKDRWTYILVDAPPSVSLVTENVLVAAREVVIPVALTYLALDGCAEIVRSLAAQKAERGRAPDLAMVVATLDRRTQLSKEILSLLRNRFPEVLAKTALPWSVKIDEAQSHGRTIFEYAPRSSGAQALALIAQELRQRGLASEAA